MTINARNINIRNASLGRPFVPGPAWLDFTNINTITKDGSNRISQINNLGTDPANTTQGEVARQPIWTDKGYSQFSIERAIGRFQGTDDVMNMNNAFFPITANGETSYFCLAKISSGSPSGAIISQYDASSGDRFMFFTSGGMLRYWKSSTSFVASTTTNPSDDVWRIYGFTKDTSQNIKIYVNNSQEGSGVDNRPFPNFNTRIGGRRNFDGNFIIADMAEVFIFAHELTAQERTDLHFYIKMKYGF